MVKGHDPYGQGHDPYGQGHNPYGQGHIFCKRDMTLRTRI